MVFMDIENFKLKLPQIEKTRHKYDAGFVVGIAGSTGMYGAAKLSALSSLRSGCGIVKMISEEPVPDAFYELVNIVLEYKEVDEILKICNKADSVFIGPGLGRSKKLDKLLEKIFSEIEVKTILDADALYFLSNNLNLKLPKDCVLTPHKKEMLRLLEMDKIEDESQFLEKVQKFAEEKNSIIVLKGNLTTIFHPNKKSLTIAGADPGLATAGTGDVLTGMIASFASQKLDLYEASVLAVNLHSLASTIVAKEKTSYCLIASDIIEALPKIFKEIL